MDRKFVDDRKIRRRGPEDDYRSRRDRPYPSSRQFDRSNGFENYRLNNERSFDRRHNWRGGDWRRTATFRQSGGGGGRFDDVNFQNRRRQTNRRPDDEPEKPILNLFDPTDVPKGRGYFEHEDRGNYPDFKKRRGSFMNRREDQQYNFRGQQRNGATDDVDSGFMWSHDKYEEVQQELQRAKSGEKK